MSLPPLPHRKLRPVLSVIRSTVVVNVNVLLTLPTTDEKFYDDRQQPVDIVATSFVGLSIYVRLIFS